jgi:hypothetical protein
MRFFEPYEPMNSAGQKGEDYSGYRATEAQMIVI